MNCPDCDLRKVVVATISSRRGISRVPMRLKTGDPGEPRWLGVVVSTAHFSGVVMLSIDEFAPEHGGRR